MHRAHRQGSLILLLITSTWLVGCRHTRSKAKGFLRLEKNLLETGDWVNKIPNTEPGYATICSFNIQVLGTYKERQKEEAALMAQALSPCALVIVQEIITPPIDMEFPNGEGLDADPESKIIFDALTQSEIGFSYLLSPEDTGRWINHRGNDGSEFFAFFYKPDLVKPVDMALNGFLQTRLRGSRSCATDKVEENTWDRVPYAQTFRFTEGGSDFIVVNSHLHATSRKPCIEETEGPMETMTRRSEELNQIFLWVQAYKKELKEKDFLIVGDLNLNQTEIDMINTGELPENEAELRSSYYDDVKATYWDLFKNGYRSMNASCIPTNSSGRACLDNVIFHPQSTPSVDEDARFQVLNLKGFIKEEGYCENKPLVCDRTESTFAKYFSDHNPVFFPWKLIPDDD